MPSPYSNPNYLQNTARVSSKDQTLFPTLSFVTDKAQSTKSWWKYHKWMVISLVVKFIGSLQKSNMQLDIFKANSKLFDNWCQTQNFHLCSNHDKISFWVIWADRGDLSVIRFVLRFKMKWRYDACRSQKRYHRQRI